MPLNIQVLHNAECSFWQITWKMLAEMIAEGTLDARLEAILISDDADAAQYRFAGSPQVMVNGKDIDPMTERVTNFHASGCRLYLYNGEVYDYPPLGMLTGALSRYR